MSLINDALKRAKQTQPLPPPVAPGPAMTPVEHKRQMQWPVIVVPVLLLAAVVVATWFFWAAVRSHRQGNAAGPTKVSARERASATDGPSATDAGSSSTGRLALAPSAKGTGPDTAQSSATNAASTSEGAGAAVDPPKPPPPTYKLQAIFYRPKNPSAVINSKTLFRGDRIADAKVLAIDRDSVTLLANGRTNVLTLP